MNNGRTDPKALEVLMDDHALAQTPAGKMLLATFTRSRRQYFETLKCAYAVTAGERTSSVDPRQAMRFPYERWSPNDAAQFRAQLEDRIRQDGDLHLAPSTCNRVLSVMRRLLRTAGVWSEEYARALKSIRHTPDERKHILSDAEQRRVFRHLARRSSLASKRDMALFAVALSAGLRVSEIANLPASAYHSPYLTVVDGKGRKDYTWTLSTAARRLLERWLTVHSGPFMFPAIQKKGIQPGHLSWQSVESIVKKHLADAKLSGTVHTLRATYISGLLRREKNIEIARKLARHSSVATTQLYTVTSREAVDKASLAVPLPVYDWMPD
jgi:integrase/recombinase XerD